MGGGENRVAFRGGGIGIWTLVIAETTAIINHD